jgi:hypothetical protein
MSKIYFNGYGYENISIHTLPYPLIALAKRDINTLKKEKGSVDNGLF